METRDEDEPEDWVDVAADRLLLPDFVDLEPVKRPWVDEGFNERVMVSTNALQSWSSILRNSSVWKCSTLANTVVDYN